jgi:hypothetical protein
MGSIFANALLTLVAAAGKDSEKGMFNTLSTYGKKAENQRIALHTVLPGSKVSSTLHFVPSDMISNSITRAQPLTGPLRSRAWCLQEDLLSPRKLYYASDQLYWKCDHLAVSEDGLAHPDFPPSISAPPSPSNVKESELAAHASYVWYEDVIESGYSMRTATRATDRLIAVAGLARHAANTIKSRYLAGLWENSVLEGLLWEHNDATWVKKSKTHCAPSWSWASW